MTSPLNWRDQLVVAVGFERRLASGTRVRMGYNYGRNPIPDATLTPLFNLIPEHYLAGGASWFYDHGWEVGLAFQYVPQVTVRYSNPALGLGDHQSESWGLLGMEVTLMRRW